MFLHWIFDYSRDWSNMTICTNTDFTLVAPLTQLNSRQVARGGEPSGKCQTQLPATRRRVGTCLRPSCMDTLLTTPLTEMVIDTFLQSQILMHLLGRSIRGWHYSPIAWSFSMILWIDGYFASVCINIHLSEDPYFYTQKCNCQGTSKYMCLYFIC